MPDRPVETSSTFHLFNLASAQVWMRQNDTQHSKLHRCKGLHRCNEVASMQPLNHRKFGLIAESGAFPNPNPVVPPRAITMHHARLQSGQRNFAQGNFHISRVPTKAAGKRRRFPQRRSATPSAVRAEGGRAGSVGRDGARGGRRRRRGRRLLGRQRGRERKKSVCGGF